RNLRRTLAQYAGDAVRLTVCDLSKEPSLAERDGVHFTPSLVAGGPGPRTWIVGHLGNPEVLQAFLEAALEPKQYTGLLPSNTNAPAAQLRRICVFCGSSTGHDR